MEVAWFAQWDMFWTTVNVKHARLNSAKPVMPKTWWNVQVANLISTWQIMELVSYVQLNVKHAYPQKDVWLAVLDTQRK